MQLVLICRNASGQASFPAEIIDGIPAPQRRYDIVDGMLTLSGYADVILHHDAEELLKQSIFRMPTPAEQEGLTQEQQQASTAQESAPSVEEETPPAQSKKKASGG